MDWTSARIAPDAVTEVKALRNGPGRDIIVLNSAGVIQALLRADLVDEIRVDIAPSVLGSGLRLFPEGLPGSSWRLDGALTFATGAVGPTCRRA